PCGPILATHFSGNSEPAYTEPTDVTIARRTTFALDLFRPGWLAAVLCCAAAVCSSTGCVQRRLTIRSNPPGALVIIDQNTIGITPCSTDYIYYGKRHIQLIRDGYETLDDDRWIAPPWYEIPPIDLVSENFYPYEIRDERIIDYQLTPLKVVPTQPLIGRAEDLRQSPRMESIAPSRTPGWFSGLFGPPAPRAPSPHAVPVPAAGVITSPVQPLPPPPGAM
ncbi:MAG TPA: PEGA domain-containing protein, partial [Pirellulales bacterium]|nr:PEGA domain-containing protein [Pirellulales bacterium]